MSFEKITGKDSSILQFPAGWRDDPEGEWLKFVDPELRKQGGVPGKFMASALERMPANHHQREEVQRVYDALVEMQMEEIQRKMKKGSQSAQQVGMQLEVNNLKTAKQYNGRKVLLCEWVPAKQRWRCELDDGEHIGVNPRNLY